MTGTNISLLLGKISKHNYSSCVMLSFNIIYCALISQLVAWSIRKTGVIGFVPVVRHVDANIENKLK